MSKAPATPDDSDASDQGSTQHRLLLRMPTALYEELKAAAAANRRSLNSEVLSRLERVEPTSAPVFASTGVGDIGRALNALVELAPLVASIGPDRLLNMARQLDQEVRTERMKAFLIGDVEPKGD